jgi:hypothetical protein
MAMISTKGVQTIFFGVVVIIPYAIFERSVIKENFQNEFLTTPEVAAKTKEGINEGRAFLLCYY